MPIDHIGLLGVGDVDLRARRAHIFSVRTRCHIASVWHMLTHPVHRIRLMKEARVSSNDLKFYIDGAWVKPALPRQIDVINPATETPAGSISLGSEIDVDGAVAAARRAFESYSQVSLAERMALLARIIEQYECRIPEIAEAVTAEMDPRQGSPAAFMQARRFPC